MMCSVRFFCTENNKLGDAIHQFPLIKWVILEVIWKPSFKGSQQSDLFQIANLFHCIYRLYTLG